MIFLKQYYTLLFIMCLSVMALADTDIHHDELQTLSLSDRSIMRDFFRARVRNFRDESIVLPFAKDRDQFGLSHLGTVSASMESFGAVADSNDDPISGYETSLPHASRAKISRLESALLSTYLNDPNSVELSQLMAIYHALRLPRRFGTVYRDERKVRFLQHAIYVSYFVKRAQTLGNDAAWLSRVLIYAETLLASWLPSDLPLDDSESSDAQLFFLQAFNFNEADRYRAADKLLDDLLKNPTNLTTNAYVIASNIWNAGEAEYADPTILYSMVLSSYFAERVLPLYQRAEEAWVGDPQNNRLYRLATLLGGWSVPARRWLAKLHGDEDIVSLLDEEHRVWFEINPYFHSASIGWMLFDEPENIMEGFQSTFSVFGCSGSRACTDRPRFSFNILNYSLLVIDYFLKLGDTGTAGFFLTFKYNPDFQFDSWLLGQEAWEHREANMMEIVERYQNDDPHDDPTTASLKSHKWGPNTITCQLCHQAQARTWTENERATVILPSDSDAFVGDWPEVKVEWDGSFVP